MNEYPNQPSSGTTPVAISGTRLCSHSGTTPTQGFVSACSGTGGAETVYLQTVPTNPSPNGAAYTYRVQNSGLSYQVNVNFEGDPDGAGNPAGAGPNCVTPQGITAGACP